MFSALNPLTEGSLNSRLHAVWDGAGRSLVLLFTNGQISDCQCVAPMFDAIADAKTLFGYKGYDADCFRSALKVRGTEPWIPPKSNRKTEIPFDPALYENRHNIEAMFGKLKDWRCILTRYDRYAHAFKSAIAIAATLVFWINQCC